MGTGLAGVTLLGAAGCGVFQQGGKSIAINLENTIRDLNSTTTTDSISADVLLNVMSGLYRLNQKHEPVPDMAKDVQISDDQLTHTFTLRDGVKWSNGDPVTSQDFKYAWLRAIDPETAGQYAYILTSFVRGATAYNAGEGSAEDVAIEVPDDKTLRVTLEAPSPFWLGLTSLPYAYLPQKQEFVEQQGDQYAQNADALLYNGPYTLTEFDPTRGVSFAKNRDYWGAGSVDIEKIEGRIVGEQATAVNLYESGELDETNVQSQYVDEYRDTEDFWSQTYFSTAYLVFNYAQEIFKNGNVRRAFQMGFDRRALANEILNDGSEGATGYVPAGVAGPAKQTFREALGPTMPDFDPEEARKLFQQGIEAVGQNPTIELLAFDDSTARDVTTFLQSQFAENLGAKIDVKVQPFDSKLELEDSGQFQLSWQIWIADYDDPMTFLDLWLSDSPFNTQKYSNERFDGLINDAKAETNFARRMEMLSDAERILVEEDAGTAPMYYGGHARIVKPYIKDYVYHPYGAGKDIKWWKVEK